ncbi:MAG: TM2 domain-containing protein [Parvularcula sp.]|jgi:TM2 domain-containing membrane protein YozV|nr:TM2 domain-containing protein [Parvularcula sp.]
MAQTSQTNALSLEQQALIEARLANEKPSTGVSYLLWMFLWSVSAHRFYLGRPVSAVIQIILLWFGWLLFFIPTIVAGIWLLVDAFLIPGMIKAKINKRRQDLQSEWVGTEALTPKKRELTTEAAVRDLPQHLSTERSDGRQYLKRLY